MVWVVYFLVYLGTIMRRAEPHIYVANWFYLAFILTIAVLHLGNNAAVPLLVAFHPSLTLSGLACRTPWCSGGMAITQSGSF